MYYTPLMMMYCLLGTVAVEGVLAFLCGVRKKSDQLILLLVNVLTNSILVLIESMILLQFGRIVYIVTAVVIEIAVIFAEGFICKTFLKDRKHPILLSLFLNTRSFLIGLGLNSIIF